MRKQEGAGGKDHSHVLCQKLLDAYIMTTGKPLSADFK